MPATHMQLYCQFYLIKSSLPVKTLLVHLQTYLVQVDVDSTISVNGAVVYMGKSISCMNWLRFDTLKKVLWLQASFLVSHHTKWFVWTYLSDLTEILRKNISIFGDISLSNPKFVASSICLQFRWSSGSLLNSLSKLIIYEKIILVSITSSLPNTWASHFFCIFTVFNTKIVSIVVLYISSALANCDILFLAVIELAK